MKVIGKEVARSVEVVKEYNLKIHERDLDWNSVKVTSSKIIYNYVKNLYSDDIELYESFYLILLDRGNKIKGHVKISQGGVSGTIVDTKLVALYAIETLSSSVILVHNHPSGTLKPSQPDIKITNTIKQGLKLFEINTLDHLIVASNGYYSFADEGILI